jgi:hypothetical protein
VLIVDGSIASLKVALADWLIPTPVAAFAGTVKLTVGGVTSAAAPVVKVQGFGAKPPPASAFPARSVAPAVIVAVKVVLAARALVGVKVAMAPALPA